MSKSYIKIPRTNFLSKPFVNGYTDIDKHNTVFVIGGSDAAESIFEDTVPEYIKMRCRLTSKAVFPDVTISAGYRTFPSGQDLVMQKKLYDGSEISMKNMVSEVDIEFLDFPVETGLEKTIFGKNPVIFKKVFTIQNISKRIPNYPDNANEQSEIFMTKSDAHFFAGMYYSGIKISDIQPCLFYVGTNARAEPYLRVISAKNAIQTQLVEISKDIDVGTLSTLEDDICNGAVKFVTQNHCYCSISAQKTTLTSNVFTILFQKY